MRKLHNCLVFAIALFLLNIFSGCVAAEFLGEAMGAEEIGLARGGLGMAAEETSLSTIMRDAVVVENDALVVRNVSEVNSTLARIHLQDDELWIKTEGYERKLGRVLAEDRIMLQGYGEVKLPGKLYYVRGYRVNLRLGPGENYKIYSSVKLENGQLIMVKTVPNSDWWKVSRGRGQYLYIRASFLLPLIVAGDNNNTDVYQPQPTVQQPVAKQRRTCSYCNGNGRLTCSQCRGAGSLVCSDCQGHGSFVCNTCSGHGALLCTDCNGKGTMRCRSCRGTGMRLTIRGLQSCASCSGTGSQTCSTCFGNGHLTCNTCFGNGRLTCTRCAGNGRLTCTVCYGNGQINCSYCNGTGYIEN